MNGYYAQQFVEASAFQDFVVNLFLRQIGIALSVYSSQRNQCERGETFQGVEIKYDKQFQSTGNLYIEVAEKSDAANRDYVPSGIYREDNTWIWAIGDYRRVFLFDKKWLRRLYENSQIEKKQTPTSRGFLLNEHLQGCALKELRGEETKTQLPKKPQESKPQKLCSCCKTRSAEEGGICSLCRMANTGWEATE